MAFAAPTLSAGATYWRLRAAFRRIGKQHHSSLLLVNRLFGTLSGKRIACVYKADTNDTRETPAIRICRDLQEEGAQLAGDAALLLIEWQQFRKLDWPALAALMRQPAWLFDARALADAVPDWEPVKARRHY